MIMYGQRFRDRNMEAHRIVRSGAIGQITMMQDMQLAGGGLASLPPWQSLPENVGILIGHGVHNIDRIRWIIGAEVCSVSAQVERDPATGIELSSMVLMRLTSGAMATLWASWSIAPPAFPHSNSRSFIAGTSGNLDLDAYGELRVGCGNEWTVAAIQLPIDWAGEGALSPVRMEAYRRQHQEFVDAVLEEREPSVTGADGRAGVAVAEAAYLSAVEQRMIQLNL